jgi:hypothetical protein
MALRECRKILQISRAAKIPVPFHSEHLSMRPNPALCYESEIGGVIR